MPVYGSLADALKLKKEVASKNTLPVLPTPVANRESIPNERGSVLDNGVVNSTAPGNYEFSKNGKPTDQNGNYIDPSQATSWDNNSKLVVGGNNTAKTSSAPISTATFGGKPSTSVTGSGSSKFGGGYNDKYGDISGKSYKTKVPQVTVGTPLANPIDLSTFKYGIGAREANTADKSYITNRNNQLDDYFASKGIMDASQIQKELQGQKSFLEATPDEQANTARAIAERIGAKQGTVLPVAPVEQTPEQQAISNLKKEMGMADLAGEAEITDFMRTAFANQKTIDKERAKFGNWDKVHGEVQAVVDTIARNKMLDASKGLQPGIAPTESDISAAMNATGLSRERIMAIANGQGYDSLEWSKDESANQTRATDRAIEDATIQKDRALQDANIKFTEVQQSINNQIEDIKRQAAEQDVANQKMGALKGYNKSSGFIEGLASIQADASRMISRAQQTLQNAHNSTELSKGRILQDFESNLARSKFDLDKGMTELKSKLGAEIGSMQSKYSLGSPAMQVAIDNMFSKLDLSKSEILQRYTQNSKLAIENANAQIDLDIKKSNEQLIKMNETIATINANNGETLANMSTTQLVEMVKNGLPPETAKLYHDAMINKTIGAFPSLPITVRKQVEDMIDSGKTPREVIQVLKDQGYTPISSDKGEAKTITSENADGSKSTLQWNPATNRYDIPVGNMTNSMGGATGDIRGLASQFPGQAWAKNNNPAGITWNGNFDNPKPGTTAQRLIDAGINFSKGTARPANEGGNYVTFATIEDGLAAQRIMMQGTYGNSTVGQMLAKWVGTSEGPNYAKQVSSMAGVDINTKVGNLSEEDLGKLQMAKIKKESPGLFKLLNTETGPKTFTKEQENMMRGMDAKSISVEEKKQLKKVGLTPEDVYNYKADRTANRWTSGLTEPEITQVNKLADKFYGEETAKTFNVLQTESNASKEYRKGNKATDNQALIYSFAKAMDPNSVVREGEYATVLKFSQTRPQKIRQNFERAIGGQELLSDEAKNNIVNTINSKLKQTQVQYDKERSTYIKRINDYAGNEIGDMVIPSNANGVGQEGNNTDTTTKKGRGL